MATKPIFDDVPAWPTASTPTPAPKDHNRPPLEEIIPLEFREALLSDRDDFLQKLDDLLGLPLPDATDDDGNPVWKAGSVDRAACTDEKTFGTCASLVNTLRLCEKHVDETHRRVKEPYLLGGRLVDGQKNALVNRILTGRQKVEAKQQAYVRERQRLAAIERSEEEAERQRIADERARLEALAAENNIEPAALPPMPETPAVREPEPIKVRSDDGATVSVTTELVPVVTDYVKAFRLVKGDAKVREAIDAAIKRLVKTTKATELAGVRFDESLKINNR